MRVCISKERSVATCKQVELAGFVLEVKVQHVDGLRNTIQVKGYTAQVFNI